MTTPTPTQIGFLAPDDPLWAAALQRAPHDLFHLPGYLSASAEHEGGRPVAFHLALGDGTGMLLPLLLRPLDEFGVPFEGHVDATSPYGYPAPLFWGEGVESRIPDMLEACWAFLRNQKVVSLFVRMNPFLDMREEALGAQASLVAHGPTVYMDLTDPEGSWAGINQANRTFIQRTYRAGYRVSIDEWATYDAVIEAYYRTMERLEATPFYFFPKGYFYGLRDSLKAHMHLATAWSLDGQVMGGVLFSEVGGLVQYFLTGTFAEFMELSPSKLLIDTLRTWGIEGGHHTLHLGGGVGANQDGLFQFKARLSKKFKTFHTLRKVLLPEAYAALCASRGLENEGEGGFFPIYRKAVPVGP